MILTSKRDGDFVSFNGLKSNKNNADLLIDSLVYQKKKALQELNMLQLEEIVLEFLQETLEALDALDEELLELEQSPDDVVVIRGIFRKLHTIKGTSPFLGFNNLEKVSHVIENVLSDLQEGTLSVNKELISTLLKGVDVLRSLCKSIEHSGSDIADGMADILEQFKEIGKTEEAMKYKDESDDLEAIFQAAKEETEKALEKETAIFEVTNVATPTVLKNNSLEQEEQIFQDDQKSSADGNRSGVSDSSLRVDVNLLDKLMNLVGELVLTRNQILQLSRDYSSTSFVSVSQDLNRITSELQEGLMKTRMQPISTVWNKFPRVIRDVARTCGKEVRLEMSGKETELDKTIIEAVRDPLIHIIRNSVDHGIEKPDERVRVGKTSEGTVRLCAFHDGGFVIISISDDGAGLNEERIRKKALERRLVSEEQVAKMSSSEVYQLIFLPGFSTAEAVTNVSGRGVGMDVVRANVEKVGGSVEVQSTLGSGTTLRIKIPLTLAIIQALIVSTSGQRYAIPQASLVELVRLRQDQMDTRIEEIAGALFYRLRGRLLPLLYLGTELQCAPNVSLESDDPALNIVVVRADGVEFGLVVETINDTEEIVVKPLARQLKELEVYSGATIMGDGRVALILNMIGLAQKVGLSGDKGGFDRSEALEREQVKRNIAHESLLLVQVGESKLYAVPINEVSRIEEIERKKVENAQGHDVIQYRNQILSIVHLSRIFAGDYSRNSDYLKVVVHEKNGKLFGIVVDQVLEVVNEEVQIVQQGEQHGVRGTAIICGKVTDLLDIGSIVSSGSFH